MRADKSPFNGVNTLDQGERRSVANEKHCCPGESHRLDRELKVELWSIAKLHPYCRNPRKNDHAVYRMMASIQEFGFKIPILVRGSGEVVDGHLRLKAAQKLRLSEVPVILCDEWSEAQVKAFRLMVNRSATWANWDPELVALDIQELKALDFDLSLTGFDATEIDDFLFGDEGGQAEEDIPEPCADAVTQLGDLWLCGQHRVLCGDATSEDAVGLLLGAAVPALMVSDPPYGVQLDPQWRERAGLGRQRQAGTIPNDDRDDDSGQRNPFSATYSRSRSATLVIPFGFRTLNLRETLLFRCC